MTALIADVASSTAIGERLGPERSKFLFDAIVGLMRDDVERFGGIVAQLTGDGVFALFGVPVAHGADAERAVRAALAIHASLARYAAEVGPGYGIELHARVAVNTGPAVIPAWDAPVDVLYNALGDTVNVAARLQTLGDVVIGPATAQQVRGRFDLEALGPVELKGRSELVIAFRVLGLSEGLPASDGSPFVGRARELALLDDVFERLLEGTGAIVSIAGEPGIGKSRLVAEAERRLGGRVRFLAGQAIAYADTIPYWPVRDLLLSWLGLGASPAESLARLELRSELARVLPGEGDDAYPYLATLIGLSLDPANAKRIRDQTPNSVRHETDHWLSRIVVALARNQPLAVVLDDLQWSDEATLALLDKLLPAAEHEAVTFLLIHRSDPDHPAWPVVDRARRRFRPLFLEVEVQPLSDDEARQLAVAHAGADIPDELAQRLVERAGGNPYFVDEAIHDLRERGALGRDADHAVPDPDASVPAALQEAVQARLDRIEGDARELIATAAVIGRTFSISLLERLMPRTRLMPALSELQWLQLVVEEGSAVATEYRFRHGLVQEVAYSGLLDAHRRDLHRRVGEALLELYRDTPDRVLGLLARHFAEANDAERAIDYLIRAGDAARAVYAGEEAIASYRRALSFLTSDLHDGRARQTLLKIAQTHHVAFDFRAANDALEEAFARPSPLPIRLEPLEHLTWCLPGAWDREMTPGRIYSWPALCVARNLYAGLLALGPDMEIEPVVAERFTISDDGLTYRFALRADASWSDGVPVTAGDFAFTFARMTDEGVASASWLDGIDAIAIDSRTLEINLREARNEFLSVLAEPPLYPWPRHIHERYGPEWHRQTPLVGNGPFVLASRDAPMQIQRSPTWHGPHGNVSTVTIELATSPDDVEAGWRHETYDVVDEMLIRHPVIDGETRVQRAPGMPRGTSASMRRGRP